MARISFRAPGSIGHLRCAVTGRDDQRTVRFPDRLRVTELGDNSGPLVPEHDGSRVGLPLRFPNHPH